MRVATCLAVGLAAVLAGCDTRANEQMESEAKNLQARCEAFRRENDGLKTSVDNLTAENTAMGRKQYGLQTENDTLKKQLEAERVASAQKIEQLTRELALARGDPGAPVATAVADPAPAPKTAATARSPAVGTSTPAADGVSVAEMEKTVADMDGRIKTLQSKVGLARNKIMGLARATIDQQLIPPAGGKIENGQVYRREPREVWPYYIYAPIGPAVKTGDFRSFKDKEDAIRAAKEEASPMEQELKSLQDELAAAKAKLGKLRMSQPGG
jgi:regulator of replication initiation timing